MKLRKLSAFIIAGTLLATQISAVSADEVVLDGTTHYEIGEQAKGEYGIMLIDEAPAQAIPTYVTISGKITESTVTEDGTVESVLVDVGEDEELQLNISYENTVIIDANGTPVGFEALTAGTEVYAAHSMAQTMSIPPQSAAFAIVISGENEALPKYMEIKEITETDGKTAFESTDGNYLIAFDETTEFVPYKTRNIVTSADLKEGSKVFAWYGISTKSIPEQALATKIMILPEEVTPSEEDEEKVIIGAEINGIAIDFAKYGNILPKIENGVCYIPVRAICEATGASVAWDGALGTITIDKDGTKAELKIGSDKAVVSGEEITLAAAPQIIEDRTVIGVSADLEKYGLKFIAE